MSARAAVTSTRATIAIGSLPGVSSIGRTRTSRSALA
jgi:hypothetical protein